MYPYQTRRSLENYQHTNKLQWNPISSFSAGVLKKNDGCDMTEIAKGVISDHRN
jgi:hypothetical protein